MATLQRKPTVGKRSLAAIVGAACASMLVTEVPKFEGMILRGYKDPIGIVTACAGHTKTAVLGRAYTREECDALLMEDLAVHAEGVLACTPGIVDKPGVLGAAVSFAFNVGDGAYCRSTMAQKFNRNDYIGGCAELSKWIYAGGKVYRGLQIRRASEREVCEGGLK
jgi:lysozyme